jgi:predicted RNA-binding protein with PUA-like domain
MSAQDPQAAYYDPKDKDPENPRWSVVHVEFRRKFREMVSLREIKECKELESMMLRRQSRLSVSKVSEEEWKYIMNWAERKEKEEK